MFNKINNKKVIVAISVVIISILIIIIICSNKDSSEEIIDSFEKNENIVVENTDTQEVEKNIIHITGEVRNTGIVEVNKGARIIDVIEQAGGLTEIADISKVNLAYVVKDAQKIYIPSIYDEAEIEYISTENGDNVIINDNNGGEKNMININTATQTELEELSGIGPSTALKIVNYREENGNFKSIEDIKNVPGIGEAKYNNIKDMIEV